jgi:Flp pilus assembly protein TadG
MRRRLRNLSRNSAGTAAIEFAFALPLFLLAALGTYQFGLTINNYLMLTDAARTGARMLALSRGSSTPYSDTVSQVQNSASNLTSANLTIVTRVNGTACSTNSTCQTALNSAAGQPAYVSVSYPCNLQVMNYNFAPTCTLSAQTTERIE